MTIEQLKIEALALDPVDREALAEAIFQSLDKRTQSTIDAEWAEECQRRIAAVDRGEMSTRSGDAVMSELLQRFSR